MDIFVTKLPNCTLAPASYEDQEALQKFKVGDEMRVKISKARNLKFHRKFFALMNFAFDYWEPPIDSPDPEAKWQKKVRPEKNFDRFRKDITILAGYYESTFRLDGSIRIEAKSIAFGAMSEDEFEALYSKVIDVILKKITPQYSEEELRSFVDQVMSFA